MPARTCKSCGKLFSSVSREICPACVEKEKQDYHAVEDYLRKNPGAPLVMVSEGTGVDEKVILKFIKEGRLKGMEDSIELKCETCGKSITTGRLCPSCMNKFSAGLKESGKKDDQADETGELRGMLSKRMKDKEE